MGWSGDREQGRGAFVALTAHEVHQHVVTRVRAVAAAQPGALAVDDGSLRLDYAELERRAAALSARIAAVAPAGEPVAVLLGQGATVAVAVLAVIGTGAPVVVLDSTTPVARLRHYVELAGATTVVTDAVRAADGAELCARVVRADRSLVALGEDGDPTASALAWPCSEEQLDSRAPVVIVFTSGSTGRPKGVSAHSESVLHDATTNGRGCYGPGAVIANLLPMAFSAGIGLLLAGLATGSGQVLFDPRTRPVSELPGWLLQTGATVLAASPAILRGAVAALAPGEQLGHLKAVTTAGETIHAAEMQRLRAALGPGCAVHNRYGSTETWLIAEHVIAPADSGPAGAVPVGRPVDGVSLHVVDEHGTRHDSGTGRLEVTSRWLSDGYWNAPEATAAVFTDHADGSRSYLTSDTATIDDDGVVRLLGRVDHSVKIRGHLVEPGEVDAVLHALPEVREAVVVGVVPSVDEGDDGDSAGTGRARLVAYVVPESAALQIPELRRSVRAVLPSFMVPEQVVLLDALPRTERGKLDRSALPPPPAVQVGAAPPRTDWERVVASFVARALDLDGVGAHDDFFELGGDSLAAEALMAAMAASLDVPSGVLTTRLIAENPTVAELAEALRRRRRPGRDAAVVTFNATGTHRPLFVVAGAGGVALAFRRLAERLGCDQPVIALQARGLEGGGRPEWSVRSRARHHLEQLRRAQPEGPYRLAGHSLGALVALDMAQQLREAGEEVESLMIIDSFPPDPDVAPPALEGPLPQRAKILASILLTGVVQSRGLGHYDRFHLQGKLLQRRYRSQPWAGRALVLVAADDPDADARSRWAQHLTGTWSLHRTGGDHTGVLQEPHVGPLARLVRAELDALDRLGADAVQRPAGAA
ncbi:Acyl-CoA synthetase (AMP-forming)/AMP-acid ligase II [Quadrisphaera granulorum]|uniref:Acyl-CoA synthetase (AMP-forming)/AMP-acid ligase II n=1 Tax=Quadrisphaera granulorum TaxID=317664 RepID=A0A316A7Q0_9ACTN|nr:AMP-binding protein [Quadrisphaera granulorum]PWJ53956.1 acyl-CoA synthetase (AMP-forming)/AMP-acid ligase II [Quadrisphaera granulorum]SZE96413.1 Acyl-CoA synthetase (AMP-forming)/AMP-acid ligase II [Quadrisphaera granulorum]